MRWASRKDESPNKKNWELRDSSIRKTSPNQEKANALMIHFFSGDSIPFVEEMK